MKEELFSRTVIMVKIIQNTNFIEDVYSSDDLSAGGTAVENSGDFYMAFKASEVIFVSGVGYEEGESWYGWVHVSVDDELNMTLLGEGINLYGGPVVVGAIPEPSAGMLLLLGLAGLALRRRPRPLCNKVLIFAVALPIFADRMEAATFLNTNN